MGNQGGIRSAAMLGFDVPKQAFVATSTAVALMVDGARVPVYLITYGREIAAVWPIILAAMLGVCVGTLVGERVLRRIPESIFRRLVSAIILVVGIGLLAGGGYSLLTSYPPPETKKATRLGALPTWTFPRDFSFPSLDISTSCNVPSPMLLTSARTIPPAPVPGTRSTQHGLDTSCISRSSSFPVLTSTAST